MTQRPSSEFDLVARHFTRPAANAVLGVGDDCALVDITNGMDLAVSTDTMVSGTHFFPDVDPENLGHKTLAVNLSDMAAMGAMPYWAMLALTLPSVDHAWLAAFARGFFDAAARQVARGAGAPRPRRDRRLGRPPRRPGTHLPPLRRRRDRRPEFHPGLRHRCEAFRHRRGAPGGRRGRRRLRAVLHRR